MNHLPARRKRPKMLKEPKRSLRCHAHYQWVGGFPCSVPGCEHDVIQRHHVQNGIPQEDRGGMSEKNHDKWCIPLCVDHHMELDSPGSGPLTFEAKYKIDMKEIARGFWKSSPYRAKYEAAHTPT